MKSHSSTLLAEVRSFRQNHPDVRYVDLIALDIPGHFYGKRYPVEMLEKVAAGSPLKLPQNAVLLGVQGGCSRLATTASTMATRMPIADWYPARSNR